MRQMIDEEVSSVIQEIGYTNKIGEIEFVKLNTGADWIDFQYINDDTAMKMSSVYITDLPKFIQACQAAYDEMSARKLRNGEYDNA